MAVYFQRNLRLLIRKLSKLEKKQVTLEFLSVRIGIPRLKLEIWLRDSEPVIDNARKLANFFSAELKHEIKATDILHRDLTTDPFFANVI